MQLTPRDKRMVQILGAVAALALVFFLVTTVFGGGDEGDVALPTGPSGVVVGPTGQPSVTPTPTPAETLPPVVLAGSRDPFSTPPELAPAATTIPTGVPTSGVPTTGVPTTPGTLPTTVTTTTSTFPTSTTTSTFPTSTSTTTTTSPGNGNGDGDGDGEPTDRASIGGHEVRLVSASGKQKRAEVLVDGDLYTVEEGATFGESFKLVSIKGPCARFLFGDDSFTLCLRD